MKTRFIPIASILAFSFMSSVAAADDFNMKVTTSDIILGKHLLGPDVKPDDLKHHVVLLEFWGVN